jgi:hypothetical protein
MPAATGCFRSIFQSFGWVRSDPCIANEVSPQPAWDGLAGSPLPTVKRVATQHCRLGSDILVKAISWLVDVRALDTEGQRIGSNSPPQYVHGIQRAYRDA